MSTLGDWLLKNYTEIVIHRPALPPSSLFFFSPCCISETRFICSKIGPSCLGWSWRSPYKRKVLQEENHVCLLLYGARSLEQSRFHRKNGPRKRERKNSKRFRCGSIFHPFFLFSFYSTLFRFSAISPAMPVYRV